MGIEKNPENLTLYNALLDGVPIEQTIVKTDCDGLDLVPADKNLVAANWNWSTFRIASIGCGRLSHRSRERYDYILIDCPPALDLLTLNALVAADSVLIPDPVRVLRARRNFAAHGTIDKVREAFSHPLKIEGILLTMYDDRTNLTRQVADDLKDFFRMRS